MYFTHEGNEVKLWSCTTDCRERGIVNVTVFMYSVCYVC